jgi:D-sedoheptulose 7-phosphate isomerase
MKILDDLSIRYPALSDMMDKVTKSVNTIIDNYRAGGKVIVAGNGGSAADALHIAGEFMKSFKMARKLNQSDRIYTDVLNNTLERAVPAISLVGEAAFLTAWGNDNDSKFAFAQQIYALGKTGDVFIAITTSGNSENIVLAAQVAKAKQISIIVLTGQGGGKIAEYADVLLNAPETETFKIQELHLPIYHAICAAVENELFGGDC